MRMKAIFLHFGFHAKIRCNLNDISYLSEAQKNDFQFLNVLFIRCFKLILSCFRSGIIIMFMPSVIV